MSHAAHILLVGNDGRLLNERAALLSNFWTVSAISSFDDGLEPLRSAHLLILCHTISEDQRIAWIASSRLDAPGRPIVSLEFVDPASALHRSGTDATVDHNRGPAALVSTIYELLNERGLPSRHWTAGGHTLLAADGTPEMTL